MHPDLKDAREKLERAHVRLSEVRNLYQFGFNPGFNEFAARQLRHYTKSYCLALDILWAVQERLGLNPQIYKSYHHNMEKGSSKCLPTSNIRMSGP